MTAADTADLTLLLQRRIDIISNHELRDSDPEQQLAQLQEVSEAISLWYAEHKNLLDAQLNHFLQGCSYSKALDYIHGSSAEACSPKN